MSDTAVRDLFRLCRDFLRSEGVDTDFKLGLVEVAQFVAEELHKRQCQRTLPLLMQVYAGIWSLSRCYDRVWSHRTHDQSFCQEFYECQFLLTSRTST